MSERDIFDAALAIDDPAQRAAYLDSVCAGDKRLREHLDGLLHVHKVVGSFLESPAASPAITADDPIGERPGTVIGPYKLLEQIGEGGFGVVFMAEQTQPVRRKVALKVLKPGMDTRQVVARFEAERQALALMEHPNIARVFDGGQTTTGRPYFVMELVRGVPITDFCDRNQFAAKERLQLFLSVCEAVRHAHQKGIIHRDLKPSNILVTMHDTVAVVKVIDFGVAKALGQELTEKTLFTGFAQMIGTPTYMSPEQAGQSGLDVDTRSDIYSLGVLLYELLTGTTPFDKERLKSASYEEIRRIIREEEPAKPSTRISTLGEAAATVSANRQSDPKKLGRFMRGELDWIVMKALDKDRNRRYQSANDFARDVQRFLHDEPVQACPPSPWYRFGKFARRNKGMLAVLTVLALAALVTVGTVAGSLGWMARDRTLRQAKLNLEIAHALDDAAKAREQAQMLSDFPHRWKAALAEAASELKRASGLASQDETGLEPALRERLQSLQIQLEADEADRRFAARFEEIRLEQSAIHTAISTFQFEIGFSALREAFGRHYRIAFGATPVEQAAAILGQRPKAMQDVLLAALEICLDYVPKDDPQTRQWLNRMVDAVETGPWRKRAGQALQAKDWKAFAQIVEEALTARQPPSALLRLAREVPWDSPIRSQIYRRIRRAYPGDFWVNHEIASHLHYGRSQYEEAIRYYTAALALRPHNPAACVNLGNALWSSGDLDGAIAAFREAIDGHPDYDMAYVNLSKLLEAKGDAEGARAELRTALRYSKSADAHLHLGNILFRSGRRDEAIQSYQKAIALNAKLGMAHYNLGTALLEKKECLQEAIASFQNAFACNRREGGDPNLLAWFLATCPYIPLRDPAEAVKQAQKAVELAPGSGDCLNTLGAAHYRAGNCKEAVAALEKVMALRGGNSYDWFFLAMAHWQLGEKEKARQYFDRAVAWMDKNMPNGKELGRFRAEAAELLKSESKKQ